MRVRRIEGHWVGGAGGGGKGGRNTTCVIEDEGIVAIVAILAREARESCKAVAKL